MTLDYLPLVYSVSCLLLQFVQLQDFYNGLSLGIIILVSHHLQTSVKHVHAHAPVLLAQFSGYVWRASREGSCQWEWTLEAWKFVGGPDGVRMHPICVKLHRSVHAPEISAEKPCEKFRILVERETFVEKESIHLFFPDQCQEERQFSGESVTVLSMLSYNFIGQAV